MKESVHPSVYSYKDGTDTHMYNKSYKPQPQNKKLYKQWRIQGGVRGVQMHPPFEGLPSRVLSKSAQT